MTAGEVMDAKETRRVPPRETNERERRMRARNRALLAVLLGLVALFYAIAIVRISGG